jgi:hypothetical protein
MNTTAMMPMETKKTVAMVRVTRKRRRRSRRHLK